MEHSYHLSPQVRIDSDVVRYAKQDFFRIMCIACQNKNSHTQKKNPRILPPTCFLLASSWSIIPADVVMTTYLQIRFYLITTLSFILLFTKLPKLARWKKIIRPFLNISDWDIKSWRNDTTLVKSSSQVHDNFTGSVVINNLELADVTCEQIFDMK